MPEIEEVLEELRLSILDHAYELLKCLDVDELTSDDVKEKLRLYDLKVENMTDAWLPNGRFYRLYPSIKHHRTRQNTLKSIAQSGGQFEGLWSNEFMNKPQYNYKYIQILRHYQLGSAADGYFYVSGDTARDKNGNITSSAVTALSSDILMGQALPAGYTYLYVPWPRPHFPFDAGYFYNVHMLDYDRLAYAEDCMDIPYVDDRPYLSGLPASMRYHWRNGSDTPYRTPYWFDYHYMDDMRPADPQNPRHAKDEYGKLLKDTQDHYIETENFWPIRESGSYYEDSTKESPIEQSDLDALDGKPLFRGYYELSENCKPLANSDAVFATKCYGHYKFKTTDPNRAQEFTPYDYIKYYKILLVSYDTSIRIKTVKLIRDLTGLGLSETVAILNAIDAHSGPCVVVEKSEYINAHDIKAKLEMGGCTVRLDQLSIEGVCLESYGDNQIAVVHALQDAFNITSIQAIQYTKDLPSVLPISADDENYENVKSIIEAAGGVVDIEPRKIIHCIDEFYKLKDPQELGVPNGPYKWDHLSRDYILKLKDALHHFKTYRPFWNEKTPWSDMCKSQLYETYAIRLESYDSSRTADLRSALLELTDLADSVVDTHISSIPCKLYGVYTLNRVYQIRDALSDVGCIISYSLNDVRNVSNNSQLVLSGYETHPFNSAKTTLARAIMRVYGIGLYEAVNLINSAPVTLNIPNSGNYNTPLKLIREIEENCGVVTVNNDCAKHSLFYWMNLKQTENRPSIPFEASASSLYDAEIKSIIRDNKPPVSEVTFTSYDRPTIGRLSATPMAYTRPANNNQGDDMLLLDGDNTLYSYGSTISNIYDPTLSYKLYSIENYSHDEVTDTTKAYFIGDPSSKVLELIGNGTKDINDQSAYSNFVTFGANNVHTLWFSGSGSGSDVTLDKFYNTLYNKQGSPYLYMYSNNNVNLTYHIIGVYTSDGAAVSDSDIQLSLYVEPLSSTYVYKVYAISDRASSNNPITASYIQFTVELDNIHSATVLTPVNVPMYKQQDNTTVTARYIQADQAIDIGNGYVPLANVYNDGWIMMKYSETLYYGQTAVTVYYDDFTGTWPS